MVFSIAITATLTALPRKEGRTRQPMVATSLKCPPFPLKIWQAYFQSHDLSRPLRHVWWLESWCSCSVWLEQGKSLTCSQPRHFSVIAELCFILLGVGSGLFYGLSINDTVHFGTLILLDGWADRRVENERKAFLLMGSMRKHFCRRIHVADMCTLTQQWLFHMPPGSSLEELNLWGHWCNLSLYCHTAWGSQQGSKILPSVRLKLQKGGDIWELAQRLWC